MTTNLLSGFWYNLWHPMYEALFKSDCAGEWLNWGFWFALIVVAVILAVYISVFCLMKPKYRRDEKGNIVPIAKDEKAKKGDSDKASKPKNGEDANESLENAESPGEEDKTK